MASDAPAGLLDRAGARRSDGDAPPDLGGPSARLRAATTTDDYQVWAHGFAVTASLFHSHRLLVAILEGPGMALDQLCARTRANSGHAAVMLRTLSTLGWVTRSADGAYSTDEAVVACAGSATLAALCRDVYGEAEGSDRKDVAWGSHLPRLAPWLESIERGWALPGGAADVAHLPTMLAGAVIAPLLLELRMMSSSYTAKADEGAHEHAVADVSLSALDEATAGRVGSFFAAQRWGAYEHRTRLLTLNEPGLFIIERCPAFGVCLSYRPMLNRLGEAVRSRPRPQPAPASAPSPRDGRRAHIVTAASPPRRRSARRRRSSHTKVSTRRGSTAR